MIEELQSLRDVGSFKMVKRPSGAKVLKSTWAYLQKTLSGWKPQKI